MKFFIVLFLFISWQEVLASKRVCQQYLPLISLNGEPIEQKYIDQNIEELDRMEFVLKHHNIWSHRGSPEFLCIMQSMFIDGTIEKYRTLSNDYAWLSKNGFRKKGS